MSTSNLEEYEIFAAVEYKNSDLLNTVKDAADKKFGENRSYVKNLWILREYKKRGGEVKYSGKRPSKEQIKQDVKKDVDRLRAQSSTEDTETLLFKSEYELLTASTDEDVKSLKDDLETLEYCYDEDEFLADFIETTAEKKKNVKLNKPFRTPGGPKKFSVYVKNEKGNIIKVNFGDPNMEIKRDDPERRKSFRARHNCDNPGPKTKAKYWSCKMWSSRKVSSIAEATEDSYKDVFDEYDEYTEAPLITPKSGQTESQFVSECMSDSKMNEEYPDQKQRTAVCYSLYKEHKEKNASATVNINGQEVSFFIDKKE